MSKETLTQCKMTQAEREYVAFIPSKYARKGMTLAIDGKVGLWRVDEVYASLDAAMANERSRDHANHRDFSDA